jgi:hypothetical protein
VKAQPGLSRWQQKAEKLLKGIFSVISSWVHNKNFHLASNMRPMIFIILLLANDIPLPETKLGNIYEE